MHRECEHLAAASFISFGSESWTVSGSWTNNSTSASWSIAGTYFTSILRPGDDFAALPANAPEFNNVTFNSGASTVTHSPCDDAGRLTGTLTSKGEPGHGPGNNQAHRGALKLGDAVS